MNGKPIEEYERKFIADNYLTMTDLEISAALNRPQSTLSVLRAKMGYLRQGTGKHFKKSEKEFIKENYLNLSNGEIALTLNRTYHSVSGFIIRAGLKRPFDKKKVKNSVYIDRKVERMKYLISICETTQSPYIKDKSIKELKKLSEL